MSDPLDYERLAQVAKETTCPPDSVWWLSFVDLDRPEGQRSLGACMVQGGSLPAALTRTHLLGINPGGEVSISGPLSRDEVPANYPLDTLLSRAEVEALDAENDDA